MPLQHQQDLLARLYTDKDFRTNFLNDPAAFAAGLSINESEAETLATVAASEVRWFSESLVNKRLREVAKMLPMTEQEVGSKEFERRFWEFADGFSPTSVKKHLEDALAFARKLSEDLSLEDEERNVARFESSRLRHNAFARRLSFCRLTHDPRRSIRSQTYESDSGRGFWLAVGGWSRVFFRPSCRRRSH
ncbi:MAG TPA: hypothetical protein VFZ49_02285 [Pyrinomonadaceae bacterium]